jgi:hypothetical protein
MESPVENATYSNGAIDAFFNVTVDGPDSINGQPLNKILTHTTYKGDWMHESKWCHKIYETMQFHQYNFSVTDIPFGQHTVTFTSYAQGYFFFANRSAVAYFLEKTVSLKFFVLANPVNAPESFPVIPVISVCAVIVVVGVGLLVYFKKYLHS